MATKKKSKYECKNKVKKTKELEPKATITISAKSLTTFIDAIAGIVSEARVHVTETGLRVFMVDTANVAMLNTDIACKVSLEDGAPKTFGVDINHLKKLLMFSVGHTVILTVSESNLNVSYGKYNGSTTIIDSSTLAIRKDPTKEPDVNLNAHFDMPGKSLYDLSRIFKSDGKIIFVTEDKVIYLKTECGDLEFKEVIGTIGDKNKEQIYSIYSGDYICDIAKVVKDSPIHIDVGIDQPIIISAEKDDCKIRYLLAPRIEAD